jgi:hypothetical protein
VRLTSDPLKVVLSRLIPNRLVRTNEASAGRKVACRLTAIVFCH